MKTLLTIGFLLLSSLGVSAQGVMALTVTTTDGQKQYFVLSDMPVARIVDDSLIIKSKDAECSYPLEVVGKWTYTRVAHTDIETIDYPDMSDIKVENDLLLFDECDVKRDVTVTNSAGQIVRHETIAPHATARLSLATLAPGVYMVTVNNVTIKVVKR